jgi:uncharacterized repeat protein (TIGR01451 family)
MPNIVVNPGRLQATLGLDEIATSTLTISNTGEGALNWGLAENPDVPWLDQAPTSGTVNPGGGMAVAITANSTWLLPGVYTTTLQVNSNDPDQPQVNVPVTYTVEAAVLSLAKLAFPDPVAAGQRLDYWLLLSNSGGRASNLVVTDTLPANTTLGGCGCAVGSLTTDAESMPLESGFCGAPFTCGQEGDHVVWRIDEMASGRSLQARFWVTVEAGLSDGAVIVNHHYAVVADHLAPLVVNEPVTTTVRQLQVSISKTAWPDPVAMGEQLVFTIAVQNGGGVLAGENTVTDRLPSGVSFVYCEPDPCSLVGQQARVVAWSLGALDAQTDRILTLRVSVDAVQSDQLVNAFYGIQIPSLRQVVMGPPLTVRVLWWPYRLFLPVVVSQFGQ